MELRQCNSFLSSFIRKETGEEGFFNSLKVVRLETGESRGSQDAEEEKRPEDSSIC
jgi:hypothetical protein